MKRHRISLSLLMAIIALVAIHLGILRDRYVTPGPLGLASALVVEFGLFQALIRRGVSRAWWAGFGAGAAAFIVANALFPSDIRVAIIVFCRRSFVQRLLIPLAGVLPMREYVVVASVLLQISSGVVAGSMIGWLPPMVKRDA